jgi:glycosyltransferase involved in cell wall biosynthesis
VKDLTICIPTFNRDNFLTWTLEKTVKDFPEAKIVISDNGKSAIRHARARYLRQPTNIGAFNNMRTALLAASTKYAVFCGDDDYLLPEEVQKGIDFLETHPEVFIYYAPCQLWDEINQKAAWDAFYLADDETFTHSDKLWNFICHNGAWPEHAIYRRARLDEVLQPRTEAYWCFVDLGNAALRGPVHFAKTPYYRNLLGHPVGWRSKLGDEQCLTHFDSYRWGLECLAHDIFSYALNTGVEAEVKQLKSDLCNMIRGFIMSRYQVAHRLHSANGRTAEANLLNKRMVINGY